MSRVAAFLTLLLPLSTLLLEAQTNPHGIVEVRGQQLYRDDRPWTPHGYYQIAFEVAPGNLARADHPFWATAQMNYTPAEYGYMREAGADSVRMQIAQAAADPKSPLFDRAFVEKALGAVRQAREDGLTVILAVQAESHVPGETPIALPDNGTRRVWQLIAPRFAQDRGVLYELLNEPQPAPTPENWQSWKKAMMATLRVVRESGAHNVAVLDGLGVGQMLGGVPLVPDDQVVYASHPYALQARGQKSQVWDEKFGDLSRRVPVIITEWFFGGYYCDAETPAASAQFLQYLEAHHVGLEAGVWDWAPGGFGSARWNFPHGQSSNFSDRSCHEPGYGIGKTLEIWYKTGVPPANPQ